MLRIGLNPYGLTYHLGLQGRGTPRANPNARGLEGFIDIATELGARTLEIFEPWLAGMNDEALGALRGHLAGLGVTPVVSSGLQMGEIDSCIRSANALGATIVRLSLTPVLCGDRCAWGERWPGLVANAREKLGAYAPKAAKHGLTLAIENHQDFTSRRARRVLRGGRPNRRDRVRYRQHLSSRRGAAHFAQVVAPHVRLVHLKDYRVQFTDEGIRLVRCAIGGRRRPVR